MSDGRDIPEVQLLPGDLDDPGDVPQMLIRTSFPIELELADDDILRGRVLNGQAVRVLDRAPPLETPAVERPSLGDDDIDLVAGGRVDDIELALGEDGPPDRVAIDIELRRRERTEQCGDMALLDVGADIDVLSEPRLPIQEGGHGSGDEVGDRKVIEATGDVMKKSTLIHEASSRRPFVRLDPRSSRGGKI